MPVQPPPTEWKSNRWWKNRSVEERINWSQIPARYTKHINDEIDVPSEILDWFDTLPNTSTGIVLYGGRQTGKTTLAVDLLVKAIRKHPMSGRFVSADRYVEMVKDQFDNDNELPEMYTMPHLIKYIQGVFDLIVLDDLGRERQTEFSRHTISSLLRRRYEDTRLTIITTSLDRRTLKETYDATALDDMLYIKRV